MRQLENVREQRYGDYHNLQVVNLDSNLNSHPYRNLPDTRLVGLPRRNHDYSRHDYYDDDFDDLHVQDAGLVRMQGQNDDNEHYDYDYYHDYQRVVYHNMRDSRTLLGLQGRCPYHGIHAWAHGISSDHHRPHGYSHVGANQGTVGSSLRKAVLVRTVQAVGHDVRGLDRGDMKLSDVTHIQRCFGIASFFFSGIG